MDSIAFRHAEGMMIEAAQMARAGQVQGDYAAVQLQPYKPTADIDPNKLGGDGKVLLPVAELDEAAPVYTVVMVRDQGNLRLRPALVAIFSGLLFGLGCYHLHRRDQAVWAVREAAGN